MTQLGQRLRHLRLDRGLAQEEVARRANIALATYVRIETDYQAPGRNPRGTSTTVLAKIARALEVPIADLFTADSDDEPAARPA